MWIESRVTSWPLMFRRQFAQPIDVDSVFETLLEMNAYLSNTLRHIGQIATCQETEGVIYIMNNNMDAWVTVAGGNGSLIFLTLSELNTYLTNGDRVAGSIATCLETEGIVYILNNLRDTWITIDINSKLNSIEFYNHTGDTSIHFTKDSINLSDINSAHTHQIIDINNLETTLSNKIELNIFNSHTGTTNPHQTKFDDLIVTGHTTHIISDIINLETSLNSKTNLSSFNTHVSDSSIHFTKGSINLSDINSAHTHQITDVSNLETTLNNKTELSLYNSHTGTTNPHNTNFSDLITTAHTHEYLSLDGGEILGNLTAVTYYGDGSQLTGIVTEIGFDDLTSTAHTHNISDVSNLQTALDTKTNLTSHNSHTGDTTIHFTKSEINLSDISNTAHTHNISDVSNLQDSLDAKTNLISFNSHTGQTNPHNTNFSDLILTAHTHNISDVSGLQTILNSKTDLSLYDTHTASTNPHLTNFNDLINTGHTSHVISDVINLNYSLDSKLNLTGGTLSGNLTGTTIAASTLSASTYIGVDSTEVKNLSNLSGNTVTDVLNNATLSTDGVILYPTDMIAGVREEVISGTTVQVNKFWSGELFTKPKQFVVFDKDSPLASDDYNIFIPDTNITITKVYYKTKATTVTFNINHSSNVDIWSIDKQATTTVQYNDVIDNPNCLAGSPVKYQASAIGTTPANIHVTIYYTEG